MPVFIPSSFGWHRDLPDVHDYTPDQEVVVELLANLNPLTRYPSDVDLREYCTAVGDQGKIQACTACACIGLLQYCERRATGRLLEPSVLFLYQATRCLQSWKGDAGAQLRAAWKAVVRFGVPPERVWPYDTVRMNKEPSALAFASARQFTSLRYVRLDAAHLSGEETLRTVKSFLASGFPCVFGFPVYTCVSTESEIAFPTVHDTVRGGQAVVAVGYNDDRRVRSDRGVLLIRSSWGRDWGDEGYGWLPYEYVRAKLAADFWIVLSPEWLSSGEFERPGIVRMEPGVLQR